MAYKKYTAAQKRAYAKRMGKKRGKPRRARKPRRKFNGGGALKMLTNPTAVRRAVVLRQTYLNSCVVPSTTWTLGAGGNSNISLGFLLNSPFIFMGGGANSNGIVWSTTVVDTYGGSVTPDCVKSYTQGDNWSFKYGRGQVLGNKIEINARVLRDPNETDDASICPMSIHLTRQTLMGLGANKTPEQIKERPFTVSKYLGSDSKERASGVNFVQNHSSAKFNAIKGKYLDNPDWIFNTGISSTGNNNSPGFPKEGDYAYLALTPLCSACVQVTPTPRNKSPQIMLSIKVTKLIKYSEAAMADNQPVPL
jgi:hypothetical protein